MPWHCFVTLFNPSSFFAALHSLQLSLQLVSPFLLTTELPARQSSPPTAAMAETAPKEVPPPVETKAVEAKPAAKPAAKAPKPKAEKKAPAPKKAITKAKGAKVDHPKYIEVSLSSTHLYAAQSCERLLAGARLLGVPDA